MNAKPWMLAAILILATGSAQAAKPKFVLLDEQSLATVKKQVAAGDAKFKPAADALRARAESALKEDPPSVINKKTTPPSGDKHDYMSLAIYFWPNPDTKDGKPYIRKDGEVNRKDVDLYDAPPFDRLRSSVNALALAYYLFDDEKYAEGATRYLRAWFLDPQTRMNPNLNFAQFVPGVVDGRGTGIIESRGLVQLTDSVTLLEGAEGWSAADRDGFRKWINDYVTWLLESKNGKDEGASQNNHGEWYDAQVCGLAVYVGRDDVAKRIAEAEGPDRIAKQVEPDGSLPREMARTRSLHYTLFAIDPWMQIAHIAQPLGVDLYHYQSADGHSISRALDYVVPYLRGKKKWEHQTIGDEDYLEFRPMLLEAAKVYASSNYQSAAAALKGRDANSRIDLLLSPNP